MMTKMFSHESWVYIGRGIRNIQYTILRLIKVKK